MKTIHLTFLLAALSLFGCNCNQPDKNNKPKLTETITHEDPSLNSLLGTIARPSQMDLPMLWTDTIYDTCFTHLSFDGKYVAFIGWTEEDKTLTSYYEDLYWPSLENERNSLFLYNTEEKTTTLLRTTSPEGFGMCLPQIDVNNEWVYYFKEYGLNSSGFMRCNMKTGEEEYLTGCFDQTEFKLLPNSNILFQHVREDVLVSDSTLTEEWGWLGYLFCDLEMTSEGICVNKSRFYDYDCMVNKQEKTCDVSWAIILNNKKYKPQWNSKDRGITEYFDNKGHCVGSTSNSIESYDGWRGLKTN